MFGSGEMLMKTVLKVLFVFVIVLTISNTSLPFTAAQTLPPPDSIPVDEYLLSLSMPDLRGMELPSMQSRAEAERYASSLLENQAVPLLNELRELKERGLVVDYKLLPEQQAVLVQGSNSDSKSQLSLLPGVEAFFPAKGENTCGMDRFAALQEQVYSISRTQDLRQKFDAKATDTKFTIQYRDGSDWSNISGVTTPSVDVTLRVLRAGQLITQETMTSFSDGYFFFYPSYESCVGYNWALQAGDVVEITAAGKTTSTTVLKLNFWVDPFNNQVAGITAPGKPIEIRLYARQDNFCSYTGHVKNTTSDGTGNFNIDFSDQIDFNSASDAVVSITGDNGHIISSYQSAYGIQVSTRFDDISFTLKPNTAYTVIVKRSDLVITSFSGVTDIEGYGYGYSSEMLQAGDTITVQGGGRTLTYTMAAFSNYYLNPGTNQLTATTDAGRKIRGIFNTRNRSWGYLQNSCSYSSNCASTTSNSSGAFSLTSSRVLLRGDYVDLYIYDNVGNYQSYWDISSAAITASVGYSYIEGYWSSPNRDLTITLRDSGNEIKQITTARSYYYDSGFYSDFDSVINAGDTVTVTDGNLTEIMTVADVKAELNKDTDQLNLYAPNGNAVINFTDANPRENTYYNMCSERQIVNGGISIPYDTVSSQDSARINFRGSDGHYTIKYANAARLAVTSWGFGWGYTMTPNQNVTVKLLNGATLLETHSSTSQETGYYNFDFVTDETESLAGYRVQVIVADKTEEMILPVITINQDIEGNRIYGTSPSNQPLRVSVQSRIVNGWTDKNKMVTADASGNYSANFAGDFFWNCDLVNVRGQCVGASIDYYDVNEFEYYDYIDFSIDISVDAFEDDNSFANAKTYTGYQKHTFHYDDTQDWIKLTVNPADVGKTYYLMTTNLGPTMDTVLYLYDIDGLTQLARNDDGGGRYASQIYWIPDKSGTFYVLVEPYNPMNIGNCGSSYDFFIGHNKVFLPLTVR